MKPFDILQSLGQPLIYSLTNIFQAPIMYCQPIIIGAKSKSTETPVWGEAKKETLFRANSLLVITAQL